METTISIYILQLSKRRLLNNTGIHLHNITVKTVDKLFAPEWEWVAELKSNPGINIIENTSLVCFL